MKGEIPKTSNTGIVRTERDIETDKGERENRESKASL